MDLWPCDFFLWPYWPQKTTICFWFRIVELLDTNLISLWRFGVCLKQKFFIFFCLRFVEIKILFIWFTFSNQPSLSSFLLEQYYLQISLFLFSPLNPGFQSSDIIREVLTEVLKAILPENYTHFCKPECRLQAPVQAMTLLLKLLGFLAVRVWSRPANGSHYQNLWNQKTLWRWHVLRQPQTSPQGSFPPTIPPCLMMS